MLPREYTDDFDVENCFDKAGAAFGSLHKSLFSSTRISYKAKSLVYIRLILAILLYGAESWCLTEKLYNQIRRFNNRCNCAMCRVNRIHNFEQRISSGLVMCQRCLPRKMMSSWVRAKRLCGAPKMTYGRTLHKALRNAKFDRNSWIDHASDGVTYVGSWNCDSFSSFILVKFFMRCDSTAVYAVA